MRQKRGKIIVIEGADKSGKQTQTKLLVDRLKKEGVPYETMSFPRYNTPTGRIIGQCYLGKEREYWMGDSKWFGEADSLDPKIGSTYYAVDRKAATPEIKKILESKTHLILDRYYQSNMAHQGGKVKTKRERKKIFRWLKNLELKVYGIPKEDAVIFLHMPTEVAIELRKRKNEKPDGHEANIGHLQRAESTYLLLSKIYRWKKIECAPDGTVNSLRTPEDIHKEIYKHVRKIMKIKNQKPYKS